MHTYLFWCQKCHSYRDPSTLARTQYKRLGDAQGIHDLDVHNGRVPVGEVLGFGPRLSVAQ